MRSILHKVIPGVRDVSFLGGLQIEAIASGAVDTKQRSLAEWMEAKFKHLPPFEGFETASPSVCVFKGEGDRERFLVEMSQLFTESKESVVGCLDGLTRSTSNLDLRKLRQVLTRNIFHCMKATFYSQFANHEVEGVSIHPAYILNNFKSYAQRIAQTLIHKKIESSEALLGSDALTETVRRVLDANSEDEKCHEVTIMQLSDASQLQEERTEHPNNHLSYDASNAFADITTAYIQGFCNNEWSGEEGVLTCIQGATGDLLSLSEKAFRVNIEGADTPLNGYLARNAKNYARLHRHLEAWHVFSDRRDLSFNHFFKMEAVCSFLDKKGDDFDQKSAGLIKRVGGFSAVSCMTAPIKTGWPWDIDGNYEADENLVKASHEVQSKAHLSCYIDALGSFLKSVPDPLSGATVLLETFSTALSGMESKTVENKVFMEALQTLKSELGIVYDGIETLGSETVKGVSFVKKLHTFIQFMASHKLMSGNTFRQDGQHFLDAVNSYLGSESDVERIAFEIAQLSSKSEKERLDILDQMIASAKSELETTAKEFSERMGKYKIMMGNARLNTLKILKEIMGHPDQKGWGRLILSNFGKGANGDLELLKKEALAGRYFMALLGVDERSDFSYAVLSESKETLDKMPHLITELGGLESFKDQVYTLETLTGPSDYEKERGKAGESELLLKRREMHEAATEVGLTLNAHLAIGTNRQRASVPFNGQMNFLKLCGDTAMKFKVATLQGIDNHYQASPELAAEKAIGMIGAKVEAFYGGDSVDRELKESGFLGVINEESAKRYTEFFSAPFIEINGEIVSGQEHHDLFYHLYTAQFKTAKLGQGVRPKERIVEPKDRNVLERLRAIGKAFQEKAGGLEVSGFTAIQAISALIEEGRMTKGALIDTLKVEHRQSNKLLWKLWSDISHMVLDLDPEEILKRSKNDALYQEEIKKYTTAYTSDRKTEDTIYKQSRIHFETIAHSIPEYKDLVRDVNKAIEYVPSLQTPEKYTGEVSSAQKEALTFFYVSEQHSECG
ncbi:hypothetical protein DID77_02415 [Candidatus Marinamargulisbacteria bacterium SCGC AG-439-L15]|nr:hypothetical protein DID77_02415 [Candidatus Marinamargulisbacteria bacterium SCGC AG-439-L15]